MSVDQHEEAKEANQKWKYSNERTSEFSVALPRQIKGRTIARNCLTTQTLNLKLQIWDLASKRSSWELKKAVGSLSKPRRIRRRERHQTKDLMSKTIAVHVLDKSLYISLPSSAEQERELWPSSAASTELGRRRLIFVFPCGIERSRCVFSVNTFLRPLAYLADPDNRTFRL